MKKISLITTLFTSVLAACSKSGDGPGNGQSASPAKIVLSRPNYYLSEPVRFSSDSKVTTGLTWDFGDNSTSNQASPEHAYTKSGIYTVTLNSNGHTDSHKIRIFNGNASYQIRASIGEYDWMKHNIFNPVTGRSGEPIYLPKLVNQGITDTVFVTVPDISKASDFQIFYTAIIQGVRSKDITITSYQEPLALYGNKVLDLTAEVMIKQYSYYNSGQIINQNAKLGDLFKL